MKNSRTTTKIRQWQGLLEDYRLSKSTITQWCKERKLSEGAFYYWKRILSVEQSKSTAFVELSEEESSGIKLEYKEIKIQLDQNFDETVLLRCMKTLRRLSC